MIDYNPPLQPHSCLYVPPNLSWNPKHRICIEIFEKDVFFLSKTMLMFMVFMWVKVNIPYMDPMVEQVNFPVPP